MTFVALTLSHRVLPSASASSADSAGSVDSADSGQRTRSAHAPASSTITDLAALPPGRSAVVIGYETNGRADSLRRLIDLGFGVGETVEVVRRAPLGDPVVYRVCGYEAALRRTEARLIMVRES